MSEQTGATDVNATILRADPVIGEDLARPAPNALCGSPFLALTLEVATEKIIATNPAASRRLGPDRATAIGHAPKKFTAE